jgi:hypothetical protein
MSEGAAVTRVAACASLNEEHEGTMENFWQLGWVVSRLTPRWIVEEIAGRRPKRVRLSFFGTSPEQVERVVLAIVGRLGSDWRVDVRALHSRDLTAAPGQPVDLVWAIGPLSRIARDERELLIEALAGALAPGGCFIVEPAETAVLDAGLSPCSSPGVFLKCE